MSVTKGNSVSPDAVQRAVASVARPRAVDQRGGHLSNQLVRIRDRHHQMAKLVAAGVDHVQICRTMGTTRRNLEMLIEQTPAFVELVHYYKTRPTAVHEVAEYVDVLNSNMIAAEQILRDKLMEEGDEMSPSVLNKLAMDRADRLGYGKQSLNLNVNVDLAERLETRRRKRIQSNPSGMGDRGASSEIADSRSAPQLLDLKAEPVAVDQPTPTPTSTARPTLLTPEEKLELAQRQHPVTRYLHEKYSGKRFEPIDRRI